MIEILDIVGGRPVHVVAVDGQVISNAMPLPPAPVGPVEKRVGVFTVTPQDDRITIPSHGLINDDQVRFKLDDPASCVLPFPLNDVAYYHVVNARGNDFMVSSVSGGSVINITDKGVGSNEVWKYTEEGPPPTDIQLIFVQTGRATDLFVLEAATRRFGKDAAGQIWYSLGGFMNWDLYSPVDINELLATLEKG